MSQAHFALIYCYIIFYIVVLGITFIFFMSNLLFLYSIWTFISLFYLDSFYLFCMKFFPFSSWVFISLTFLDFFFPFFYSVAVNHNEYLPLLFLLDTNYVKNQNVCFSSLKKLVKMWSDCFLVVILGN